jgi:AcrR family transcriptional regulator
LTTVVARINGGKGTVFRRFGDRTGLVQAVIERRVSDLRALIESGPPPLGPGGPPRMALDAYLYALSISFRPTAALYER